MKKQRIQISHATRERMADTFAAGFKAGRMHERERAHRHMLIFGAIAVVLILMQFCVAEMVIR